MEDERLRNKNFIDAWRKAFSGIWYTIKTQRNIKIQLIIALIVVLSMVFFRLNITECIFLTFAIMLVIILEVVNLCTDKFHPIAKIAKDVAAGAVVLAALNAVIIFILICAGRMGN